MYKFNFYHTRPENFFHNSKTEQTKGLIGYIRGDFGRDGDELWNTWFDHNEKLKTNEFKEDLDKVMKSLRERLFTERSWMRSVAFNHPDSKINSEITNSYGMFVETNMYEYDIRLITENGNYDFYIYCYDKRFQEPQYLNAKRFRDENGKLTEKVEEVAQKTLAEARNYYINGDRYENNGRIYTFRVTEENMLFEGADGEKIFVVPELMGTYLPDIASEGSSFVKVPLSQTLTNLTLGDLIQGTKLSSVHLVHDEVDNDLATIEDLSDAMLKEEGKIAWADVLNAKVDEIFDGSYGVQIQCSGVDDQRLSSFSYALSGNWPTEEYDRWFKSDDEQEQNMSM